MTKPVAWQKRYRTIPCESNGWAEWTPWQECSETVYRNIQSGLMPEKQSRALSVHEDCDGDPPESAA